MTRLFENNIDLEFYLINFLTKYSKKKLEIYQKKYYMSLSLWQQNLRSRSFDNESLAKLLRYLSRIEKNIFLSSL